MDWREGDNDARSRNGIRKIAVGRIQSIWVSTRFFTFNWSRFQPNYTTHTWKSISIYYAYILFLWNFIQTGSGKKKLVQMRLDWRSFVEVSILFKSSDNISIKCSVRMSGVQPVCSTQVITSCTSKWSIIIVRWHSHVWMEKIEFIQNTQTCVCGTVCEIARSTETNREKTHLSFSALSNIRTPDNTCTICSSSLRGWRRPTTQSILCSIWRYCHR